MFLFSIGIVATMLGGGLVVHDLQQRNVQAAQQERRLDPSSPLVAEPEFVSARRGARLARLRIPSIEVDEVVVEGTSARELAVGVGHYVSTSPIGGRGSVGIAGHRTGWGDPFLRLDELDRGDRIVVETRRNRFVYRVTRSKVVEPSENWVLLGDPRRDDPFELTLTTCTPVGTAEDRLIVWAARVR